MEKLSARVEHWSVVDNLIFNGFRDLEPGQRLTGYLMGHSNLPNGVIYTSVIQRVDVPNGLVEAGNTVYRLGRVNDEYEQWICDRREATAGREARLPSFADPRKPVTAFPASASLQALRHG